MPNLEQAYKDAQAWAAETCYCPTCLRKGCPVRDKSQRFPAAVGGLNECAVYGGGYAQNPDRLREIVRTYWDRKDRAAAR